MPSMSPPVTLAPAHPPDVPPARRAPTTRLVLAAAVGSAAAALAWRGPTDALLAGMEAAALAALVLAAWTRRRQAFWVEGCPLGDLHPIVVLVGSAVAVGVGAAVGSSPPVAVTGPVVSAWVAVGLMMACFRWPTGHGPGNRAGKADLSTDLAIVAALGGTLLAASLALVDPAAAGAAAVLALVAPVGLLLVGTTQAGAPEWAPTQALVLGIGALVLVLVDHLPGDRSVAPALLVIGLAALAAVAAVRVADGRPELPQARAVFWWVGVAAAFVGVGATPSLAVVVAGGVAALALTPPPEPAVPSSTPEAGIRRPVPDPGPPVDVENPAERGLRVRARVTVTALSVVAFVLRLVNPRGLWLDELTSVQQAKLPLGEMLHVLWREDVHPPLHHLVLWADIRLLGDGELAVRLPSTVMGALLVPLVFVVGRDLIDRRTGVIAAALCATAPLPIWYAQEARMYAQFMLLAMVGVWAQTRIVRGGGRHWWVVLTVANTALVLTHWFALLHVLALHLVFLVVAARRLGTVAGRSLRRAWTAAVGVQLLLVVPLVPLAIRQFLGNQARGFGLSAEGLAARSDLAPRPSVYSLITNIEWGLFGYQSDQVTRCLVALWPIALLAVLLLLGRRRRSANRYLVFVAGLPTLVVFGGSFLVSQQRSLAEVRYFASAVPVLFLLVASMITGVLANRRAQLTAGAVVAAMMVVALVGQYLSRDNPRLYGYREALHDVSATARPGDRLVYAPYLLDDVLHYYTPGMPWKPLDAGLPRSPRGRVFVFTSGSFAESAGGEIQARRAAERLQEDDRQMIREIQYPQVTVQVFR
jgi:hypothetical protein